MLDFLLWGVDDASYGVTVFLRAKEIAAVEPGFKYGPNSEWKRTDECATMTMRSGREYVVKGSAARHYERIAVAS